jgi:hypothetical protein
MPKNRFREVDGVIVTDAHVRAWMLSVARHIPPLNWPAYIRSWSVHEKIARQLRAGTFDQVVNQEAQDAGITLRKRRRPNTIWALRQVWPHAANDAAIMSTLAKSVLDTAHSK